MIGSYRPRLCKNVFERVRYLKPDWKSRFYAKFTSADVPINFRFNVDVRTSILAKRFYTLWAKSGLSDDSYKIRNMPSIKGEHTCSDVLTIYKSLLIS